MPAPANDNQANAILLDAESGEVTGTTVDSTGEAAPAATGTATITNGADVWYKWRAMHIRSQGALPSAAGGLPSLMPGLMRLLPYMVRTKGATFRHVIRLYIPTDAAGTGWRVYRSPGLDVGGMGRDQRVQFWFDDGIYAQGVLDPQNVWQRVFIYIQIDAAAAGGETGTFSLVWGRSELTSLGSLDGHGAFPSEPGWRIRLLDRASITDVVGATPNNPAVWFGGGRSYPAGIYRVQYAGGSYGLTPLDAITGIWEATCAVIYNDGAQSLSMPGMVGDLVPGTAGTYLEKNRVLKMHARPAVALLAHTGGKIGIQFPAGFLPFQTIFWTGPNGLPYWLNSSFYTVDNGAQDNTLLSPPVTYGLWRQAPAPDLVASGWDQDSGVFAGVARFLFTNRTSAAYRIKIYSKPSYGTWSNGLTTMLANGVGGMTMIYPYATIALVMSLYVSFPDDPDVGEFGPYLFDMTPNLQAGMVFNGLVSSSGVTKWSVTVTITNANLPRRVGSPVLTVSGTGITGVEYPAGQNLADGSFNRYYGSKTVYLVPPAGAGLVAVRATVTDGAWTSAPMDVPVVGTAL